MKSLIIKGPRFQSILQSSLPPLTHQYYFDLFFSLASTYHHLRIMFVYCLSATVQAVSPRFINELMNCLFCPPHPCGFSACVFLRCSGGFQLRSQLDPLPAYQQPSHLSQLRGRASRERAAAAATAPGRPSSRPGRTRPGSRPAPNLAPGRGNWQAGAALPGGGGGYRGGNQGCSNPPPGSGQTERAWARRSPDANPMGQSLGWPRDPGAWPSHRGRSGPRPGAFRAPAAACLGKSRPPSRRRSPARQSGGGDSRNLPGDRRRVTGQNRPM